MSSDNYMDVEKLIAETEKNVGQVGYDEWVTNLEKKSNVLSSLIITNPEVQVGGGVLDISKQIAKTLENFIDHYATHPVGIINGKPWTVTTVRLLSRSIDGNDFFAHEDFNDFLAYLRETREKGFGFIFYEAGYVPSTLMFRDGTVIEKPSEFFIRGHFYPLDNQSKQG